VEQVGDHKLRSLESVERLSDPNRKSFENQVLDQFAKIVHSFEPEKKEQITKNELKQIGFEDAIRELLELNRKKK